MQPRGKLHRLNGIGLHIAGNAFPRVGGSLRSGSIGIIRINELHIVQMDKSPGAFIGIRLKVKLIFPGDRHPEIALSLIHIS